MTISSQNLSEYNQAEQWMIRIDEQLREANFFSKNKDALGWLYALETLKREISTEFNEETLLDMNHKMRLIHALISRNKKYMNHHGVMRIPQEIYILLDGVETQMRRIMREKNIYTKTGKDKRWGN